MSYNLHCSERENGTKRKNVRLAQLDRAFGYGPKGRGFESSNARYPQTDVWGFLFAGKHEECSMKLKKVYKTLAVTLALSVTFPSGFHMNQNGKHAAHVHAAGLEEGNTETSELATTAETEKTTAQESSEPVTEPATGSGSSEAPTEPATESSEPVTEPGSSEPVTEPGSSEPSTEPGSSEPSTEPVTEVPPVVNPDEPATDVPPVVDPDEPSTEPVTEIPPVVDPDEPVTEPVTEPDTEEPTTADTEPQTDETDPDKKEEDPKEENQDKPALTNEQLIALQKIVIPPAIEESFRFVTVDKDYAVANVETLQIYEGKDTSSDVVGTLGKGGVCYVLNAQDPSWYYVESGVVRGFVRISDLLTGADADAYVAEEGEANLAVATASKEPMDNSAYTYTKTTVRSTVVGKQYALCTTDGVNVREGRTEDARVTGVMKQNSLCYILADASEEWIFVESGDVRGFVKREYLSIGDGVKSEILENGESAYSYAELKISAKEIKACYYTITSIKKGSISDSIRESMLKYASQFIGNPYVWGGTSLTLGADCSGFVQSIYSAYGYSIPRVAEVQAQYGMQIPVSEAKPGDLIFYAKDGAVYHVVMYMGDGKTIEAANSNQGIICSVVDTAHAVWATRIISDSDSDKIEQVNDNAARGVSYTKAKAGDSGNYLGRFKLTAYCSCPICCGKWSGGATAGGTVPVQGRTVAMAGVPFGTKLVIGGLIYTVEDRGTPYGHVDIYMNSHTDATNFGVQYADVYLANQQ